MRLQLSRGAKAPREGQARRASPSAGSAIAQAALYFVAGIVYVTIGVFVTEFMLNVFVAIAYLMLVVWLVPVGVRKLL